METPNAVYRPLIRWEKLAVFLILIPITPYMVSFAFLAIVVAMSYELVAAAQSERYARTVRADEGRWRTPLENVQLAVIGVDPGGRIDYAKPYLCRLIGLPPEALVGRETVPLWPVRLSTGLLSSFWKPRSCRLRSS